MARQLRIEYEGAFYHITSRGNQRDSIFWDNRDRKNFLTILKRTKERYKYLLHAYVLMDNHYHLLIETPHANIKQIMQNINTSYTVYINKRYDRTGHLLQGRYKAFIVDKENYLLGLSRYIHLNPVRANIVNTPEEYRWSSYSDYINKDGDKTITDRDDTLYHFSRVRPSAIDNYKEFVNAGIGKGSPFKNVKGSILGNEVFIDKVAKHLKGIQDEIEIPEIKEIKAKYEAKEIINVLARHYKIEKEYLLKRTKKIERLRKITIYLIKEMSGKKNIEIGKIFGITGQAVTNVIRRMDKMIGENDNIRKEIEEVKGIIRNM